MKNILAVVAGLIVAVVTTLFIADKQVAQVNLGAAGTEHTNHEVFYSDITVGGNTLATTSAGTVTYTASDIRNNKLILHTASGALTATLPASSTLSSFVPRPGDVRTLFIQALTTKITLAGATGTDLNSASTTKEILVGGVGRLDFVRKVNNDIEVLLTTGI